MPLYELATEINFDFQMYIEANIDLRQVPFDSESEKEKWANKHFEEFGKFEQRLQLSRKFLHEGALIQSVKREKLFSRSPKSKKSTKTYPFEVGSVQFESLISKNSTNLPLKMEVISANEYDPQVINLFTSEPQGLFLDLGAGLRSEFRPNVINVEIDALPTTDVIAWGENLPFQDKTFDGAVCLAVLEHVQDPFAVASELVRVVKPGGKIIVDWPFLQPVHGYPHHYFNATMDGAREAFKRNKRVLGIDSFVPGHMHPAFSLVWILNAWKDSLNQEQSEEFSKLTIQEILSRRPEEIATDNTWGNLSQVSQTSISSGSRLIIQTE